MKSKRAWNAWLAMASAIAGTLVALGMTGCDKAADAGNAVVRKTGRVVGAGATEFFGGVSEGIDAASAKNGERFLDLIKSRTSIRKFDPSKPVSAEALEKILRAGMCAPSAMNRQPWEFVVVRDPGQLKAIGDALPNSRVGNGAQAAIVVCGNLDNGLPGRGKEYWIHDCSAASMNVLLAAKALGLGAVWTGVYPGEERIAAVRKILAIPDGYAPLNVIPIGHPAENPPAKDKWNPAKIHFDRW